MAYYKLNDTSSIFKKIIDFFKRASYETRKRAEILSEDMDETLTGTTTLRRRRYYKIDSEYYKIGGSYDNRLKLIKNISIDLVLYLNQEEIEKDKRIFELEDELEVAYKNKNAQKAIEIENKIKAIKNEAKSVKGWKSLRYDFNEADLTSLITGMYDFPKNEYKGFYPSASDKELITANLRINLSFHDSQYGVEIMAFYLFDFKKNYLSTSAKEKLNSVMVQLKYLINTYGHFN